MAQQVVIQSQGPETALAAVVEARFEALHERLDVMDRRFEQRIAELRLKQEEDLTLLKAMSCQLRGRAGRVERRGGRGE